MPLTRADAASFKTLLRTSCQRLGQLQEKKDSQASITRRDIATLIQQGNVALARTKAQNLIREDTIGDLLETLEMFVGLILERFHEIEGDTQPTPAVLEAASSIMYSTSHIDSSDLRSVYDRLVLKFGSDFAQSALTNENRHVSPRILKPICKPPPTAAGLDAFLAEIATEHGVEWTPELPRSDLLNIISEILDPSTRPVVDLPRLRDLCARGIPDEPRWIRPKLWKLFLGTLPVLHASSDTTTNKHRASYYDLVRQLLPPIQSLPDLKADGLQPADENILNAFNALQRVPETLFERLKNAPGIPQTLQPESLSLTPIAGVTALEVRLKDLQGIGKTSKSPIPSIRLEPAEEKNHRLRRLVIDPESLIPAHPVHFSALLRLLYIHQAVNPGNVSPHLSCLLVTMYSTICEEIEEDNLIHSEADAFWVFEALISELTELEDPETCAIWMNKLGERLHWADPDLYTDLCTKGLDPTLPHYSYHWMATLFTRTCQPSDILVIWDALISRPIRDRNHNPKLEFLVDICSAMLIESRSFLVRLGKARLNSSKLWADPQDAVPLSPFRPWELGDAFSEGNALLKQYPMHVVGGVDRILQTASDLWRRRLLMASQRQERTIGERIKRSLWKGFTNQSPSPERSPVPSDSDSSDEGPLNKAEGGPPITSRLMNTVWRGITNQSSMEPPLSPATPSPIPSPVADSEKPSPSHPLSTGAMPSHQTTIWTYGNKLNDSDLAASVYKTTSNWRARFMNQTWAGRAPAIRSPSTFGSSGVFHTLTEDNGLRRGSLPNFDRSGMYSPPHSSRFPSPQRHSTPPQDGPSMKLSEPTDTRGLMSRTKTFKASLAALTRSPTPEPPKNAPRPLLLGSSSVVSGRDRPSLSDSEKMEFKAIPHRSQSSLSWLHDGQARQHRTKISLDYGSDGGQISRRVPINRRSISPLAPNFKPPPPRPTSVSSSGTFSDKSLLSPPPMALPQRDETVHPVESIWDGRDSAEAGPPSFREMPLTAPQAFYITSDGESEKDTASPGFMLSRKSNKQSAPSSTDDSQDSGLNRGSRLRSKRYPHRPHNLRLTDTLKSGELKTEWPGVHQDGGMTPKGRDFDIEDPNLSANNPAHPEGSRKTTPSERKVSIGSGRGRKVSGDSRNAPKAKARGDTSAEEGDDEGYDDLLSAYESEEGSKRFPLHTP